MPFAFARAHIKSNFESSFAPMFLSATLYLVKQASEIRPAEMLWDSSFSLVVKLGSMLPLAP